jgi:hypothetical protein
LLRRFAVVEIQYSAESLESQALPAIRRFMAERGLELSEEKTRITHVAEGFDFLGRNVRKYGGQLQSCPVSAFGSPGERLRPDTNKIRGSEAVSLRRRRLL